MTWRKLLSVFFAFTGVLSAYSFAFFVSDDQSLAEQLAQYACIVLATIAVIVGVGAWRGHRWALLSMRAVAWAAIACLLALATADTLQYAGTVDFYPTALVPNLLMFALLATCPLFLLAVLHHRDVVREFDGRAREP
jgi:hypothetical protein